MNLFFRATLGRICLKLLVVMGLTWLADVLSWAIGGPNYMWYLSDIINALQGVFIFIVVGCQPQVLIFLINNTQPPNHNYSISSIHSSTRFNLNRICLQSISSHRYLPQSLDSIFKYLLVWLITWLRNI